MDEGQDTEPNPLRTHRQIVREFLKDLGAGVLPVLLVVIVYVALFGVDFLFGTDLAVFGVKDPATEQRVFSRYWTLIRDEQVRILLTFIGLGLVVGLLSRGLTLLWERSGAWPTRRVEAIKRRPSALRWPLGRSLLATLVCAMGLHLWMLAHAIARFPQIFTEKFYDAGGMRRALMLGLTHYVPSSLVDGLAGGTLAGLLLAPVLSPAGRRWLRRWLPRPLQTPRRAGLAGAVTAMLLLVAGLGGIRQETAPAPGGPASPGVPPASDGASRSMNPGAAAEHPSVLLIAVDSLRADRVGPWARQVAPNIAALADRSVRFDSAHVTVPRTFPSFVTLLTGRYPHHHGIRTMFPSAKERAGIGPALPETLQQEGFSTRVVSDFCGEIFSRVDLGFRDVLVPYFDAKTIVRQQNVLVHPNLLPYVDGTLGRRVFPALDALAELSDPDLLADRAIDSLAALKRAQRPFFMTVFFSSAHFPYAAPAPYYRRFTDPAYRGPFRYHKPPLSGADITKADEQQVRGLYNGAVAAADAAIGKLLAALAEQGLAEHTIVVLLADHGENLYDEPGRGMGHGDHLEGRHSLQIPLLVYDPVHHFPAHAVPGIVRDIDLAPTLLELTGQGKSALPVDGVSLAPLLRAERESLGLRSFSETELWFTPAGPGFDPDSRLPYPGVTATTDIDPSDDIFLSERWRDLVTVAKHRALRTERWKLIYRPTRTGVHWSLYDLWADPNELHDVSAQHPQEFGQLQADLLRFLADDPKAVVEGGYVIPRE